MSQVTVPEEGAVARPLNVLVPLIKQDFKEAEEAGMPFYEAAGNKLREARESYFKGDSAGFYAWAEEKFGKKRTQISTYISLAQARSDKPLKEYKDLQDFRKRGLRHKATSGVYRPYITAVDAVAERAREEARRLALEDSLTKRQEREAESKLALRLIDIGFKVLAQELHPDKGGSREAMARLNRVRNRLKEAI